MTMFEMSPQPNSSARSLFEPLENHLLIGAFFESRLPAAKLVVDHPTAPRAAFLRYNSRMIFAGNPFLEAFNASLRRSLTEDIIPAMLAEGHDATLLVFSDGWPAALETIFAGFELLKGQRLYFESKPQTTETEIGLPPGFTLCQVERALLESGISGLDALREEMCSERASVEDFLEKSFGLCPVYENELAGWCLSEYNTGERCEIGIATLEPFQRRGVAASLTRAFLAEARRRGYTRVGWDCWERNTASVASAKRAGLLLVEAYPALVALFSPEH